MLAASKMDDLKDTAAHKEIESQTDIHEYKTNEGYVIDAGDEEYSDLKLARDVSYPHPLCSAIMIAVFDSRSSRCSL
jgi:hypothetical protein